MDGRADVRNLATRVTRRAPNRRLALESRDDDSRAFAVFIRARRVDVRVRLALRVYIVFIQR